MSDAPHIMIVESRYYEEIAEELITNENVDTIGKPAVEDEFAESGHIEFPLPE